MSQPLIEAQNITKTIRYGNNCMDILCSIDFQLFPNESVAITGASGSGKSTLLHILGTLDSPTSGEVVFFGQKINCINIEAFRNKHIGFVFQNFYLLEDDSVLNNVLIPASIGKQKIGRGSEAYERALYLLSLVGLEQKAFVKCSILSGGEKQRVAIARALVNDPSILLADEPSGNLDDCTSEYIHALLLSQVNERRGVLIVTHDKMLAKQCNREANLRLGKLFFN